VVVAVALVVLLAAMNLRGVRESGAFFAIPTYGFMIGVIGMALVGALRATGGNLPDVESAKDTIIPASGYPASGHLTGLALIFLLARAFSSGSAALTGVEAISNGVPAFRKPKSKNAATTLLLLGTIAITMLISIIVLAHNMGLKYVDDVSRLRDEHGDPMPRGFDQPTVMAQLSKAVFHGFTPGFWFVLAMTGIILILAANTAFNGFPVLGSILARDGFMPRALGSRGDRLAYSNGILVLAFFACVLIVAFDAQTTRLIQLYIVGVFVSFNLSQLGMIRHWTRHLKTESDPAARRRMHRSRSINTFGLGMTLTVFVIILLTKFLAGAWISIVAMCCFFALM
jgi:amino acid transporter